LGSDYGTRKQPRRAALVAAMNLLHAHELEISRAILAALQSVPGLTVYGLTDPSRLADRVATFAFRLKDMAPRLVAEKLAAEGIYVWDGNYYAINVTERLGLEASGGMVRVGAAHYNTLEEVERLRVALTSIAAGD
jgi:selenocysteine lyase/cysteine desulfurase